MLNYVLLGEKYAIINYCADGIIIVSSQGTVVQANPAFENLTGLDSQLLKDKDLYELIFAEETKLQKITNEKREVLLRDAAIKNYMVEYLENVCIHRYAKMNQNIQQSETEEEEIIEEIPEENTKEAEPIEEEWEEQKKSEQEMRIRAILEEFLA